MKFIPTDISEVILIKPQVFEDKRGFFMESWNAQEFEAAGITDHFVQDNHSKSAQGVLRGLHYQIKKEQGKLIRVIAGEIFDVAVDVRSNSPTFGKWCGAVLSAKNKHLLWIPAGFAHGFYVTSDYAEITYKCTEYYAPEHQRSIRWNDPQLAIDWPLVDGKEPLLSSRDSNNQFFAEAEYYK